MLMVISLIMNLPAGVTQNRWKELNWLSLKVEVKSMRMKQNPSRWSWSSNVCPYIINEELCHSNYRFADPKENSFSTANVGMSAIGALRHAGQNIGWDCEKNWGFTVWGCCCLSWTQSARDTRRLLSQFSILGGYLAAPTQPSMSLCGRARTFTASFRVRTGSNPSSSWQKVLYSGGRGSFWWLTW